MSLNHYEYDYDDNSNMLGITYVDGSAMLMTYNGNQRIRSVTPRNEATTWYSYGDLYEDNDKRSYFIEVQHPNDNRDRHEYHERRNASGRWLIVKIRTTVAGITTEAEYTTEGQLHQVHGRQSIRVERDSLGRPILIAEDRILTQLSYNSDNRVTEIAQQPINAPTPTERRNFSYNAEGRLIEVKGSSGEQLTLGYTDNCLTSLAFGNQTLEIICDDQKLPGTLRLSQYPSLPMVMFFNKRWGYIENSKAEPEPALITARFLRDILQLVKPLLDMKNKIMGNQCLNCELPDLENLVFFRNKKHLKPLLHNWNIQLLHKWMIRRHE